MSAVDSGITRDGLTQLRRRWVSDAPRAVILLVHGLNEHSGRYEHVGRSLADAGFHVVAFDLRGHGMSGGVRSHVDDFEEYLDDVEDHLAEVRRVGLPVVLFGHSMGALISAAYATTDRPQPDLLVLSAPPVGLPSRQPPIPVLQALEKVAPGLRLPPMFGADTLSRDEAVQKAYLDDPLVGRRATLGLYAELVTAAARTDASVGEISVPTFVIHGADDRLVPASASVSLGSLPVAERTVYDGLRHETLNEPEWESVLADVIAWLDRQLGG